MTELENQDIDTDVELYDTDDTDNVEDVDTSNEDINADDITIEQALKWKKDAERTAKAEAKLVALKKQLKVKENKKETKETNLSSKEEVKRILAEERFYDKNPDAEAYREKIEVYQEKGLSLDDAYLLASKNDREIDETREVYGKSIVKGTTNTEGITLVSVDAFDKMTPQSQQEYTDKMTSKYGKIKFK